MRAGLLDEIATIAPEGGPTQLLEQFRCRGRGGCLVRVGSHRQAGFGSRQTRLPWSNPGRAVRNRGQEVPGAIRTAAAAFDPCRLDAPEAIEGAIDDTTAAIILEPVEGEGGIHVGDPAYLAAVREIATRRNILLIVDEIQSGFRTGAPFASVAAGVVPDIIVTAKALSDWIPNRPDSCDRCDKSVHARWCPWLDLWRQPARGKGGVETLRIFRDDALYDHAATLGAEIIARGEALRPAIRAVRGKGLMIGIELKQKSTPVLKGLQERGVLTLPAGSTVLRLLPPLIRQQAQADEFVAALGDVLA